MLYLKILIIKSCALKKIFIFLFLTTLFTSCFLQKLQGQDIHFSQYYASPLSLNPAETGFFDESWRFSNNYRNQWAAIGVPYRTISAGFDKALHSKKGKHYGLGIFFVNDHSGSSSLLVNKIFVNASYIISLNDYNFLAIGTQLGFVTKDFNLNGLSLPSQFNENSGYFDSNLPNNITNQIEAIKYIDVNIGLKYQAKIKNLNPHFGISAYHLNMPKESFFNNNSKLPIRLAFNTGANIAVNNKASVIPNILIMYHKKASDWVLGGVFDYKLNAQKQISNVFIGMYERNSLNNADAIILTTGLGIFGFDIGFSYDVNISALKAATKNKGAFEISIIYKYSKHIIKTVTIPCDRY